MRTLDGETLTRDRLLVKLGEFNAAAKAISRRGRGAQATEEYRDAHDSINAALTALERA